MAGRNKRRWDAVRAFALDLPGAFEDFPWDEVVAKVSKKIFVFLGRPDAETHSITVKLTLSRDHALSIPEAQPAGYGLGKAGWVMLPLALVDTALAKEWVEESYRNVAGKRLVAELDAR